MPGGYTRRSDRETSQRDEQRMMELTDKHMRTKTIYTDTLTRGSGTGEVSEEGKGQVR